MLDPNNTEYSSLLNIQLNSEDIEKLSKLNKILEKMEIAEKEQRKNLNKNPDLTTYTKLLNLLHKNYEISTLTANELAAHLEVLNLSVVSAVIQKIIHGFQMQLNMFLHFQINFFKKGKKEILTEPLNSSNSIFPETELLSIDSALILDEKKVDLSNKNIRKSSIFRDNLRKPLIPPLQQRNNDIPIIKQEQNTHAMDQLSYEQNMAELDNEMFKQETNLYNLGLIEARNIAAHHELQDLSKKMNKKISIPGSNISILGSNISPGSNIILSRQNPKEEIKETKSKSPKKTRKKVKHKQSVSEIAEDTEENKMSPSNKISKANITKVAVVKPNTRTQGTNPDPDIFDINIIAALKEVLHQRDISIDDFETKIRDRENNIRELESMNMFLKSDFNAIKANYDHLNTRLAESKLGEANLNIDLNNYRKEINALKKEIGNWESKLEKKDSESVYLKSNLDTQTQVNEGLNKKLAILQKDFDELKESRNKLNRKTEDLKIRNQELTEENEHLRGEINELREKLKENPFLEEKRALEMRIEELEEKIQGLEQEVQMVTGDMAEEKHRFTLREIQKDNEILEKTKKISSSQNGLSSPSHFLLSQTPHGSKNLLPSITIESGGHHKRGLSEHYVEKAKDFPGRKISEANLNVKTEFAYSSSYNGEEFEYPILGSGAEFLENNNREIKRKAMNTWTQTSAFSSDEILYEFLKERDVSPTLWAEINEMIEKMAGRASQVIYPKTTSRKNSLSGTKNSTRKPSNLINYSNIMNKILSPTNKVQFFADNNNAANNEVVTLRKENKLTLSSDNQSPIAIPLPNHLSNLFNLNNISSPTNEKVINNPYSQLSQINNNIQKNSSENLSLQKISGFTNANALKKHLKSSETGFHFENFQSSNQKPSSVDGEILNKDPVKSPGSARSMRKFKLLSNSSINLASELLKREESPRIKNFKEALRETSPLENKELWDLSKEEKNVLFENMYHSFAKMQETLLRSKSDHRKYLKHVILIKHIKKELYGDFDGDVQIPNLDEFREFMEKMVNKHRKCGKDCTHLKRFNEKIGWTSSEKTGGFANRIEFKPKTMIINTLPKIQNI